MKYCDPQILVLCTIFLFALSSYKSARSETSRLSMGLVSLSEPFIQSGQAVRRITLKFKNTGSLPFFLNFKDATAKTDVQRAAGRLVDNTAAKATPYAELGYVWEETQEKKVLAGKVSLDKEAVKLEPQSEIFIDCEIKSPSQFGRYELIAHFDNRALLTTYKMHNFFQVEPIILVKGQEKAIIEESSHYPPPYFDTQAKTVLNLGAGQLTF